MSVMAVAADSSSTNMLEQLAMRTDRFWVAAALGLVVVIAFASQRYDVPTWAKTSLGNLAQLSPKSLAPDYRYRNGYFYYLGVLAAIYAALCLIGPEILTLLGVTLPDFVKNTELWPLGAASAITLSGAVGDEKLAGRLEAYFRRKAHEAAFIPTAVTKLAQQ